MNPIDAGPKTLSATELSQVLPHRYPFLFVDQITEFEPGARIAALKHFSGGDEVAQGQQDGVPYVPTGVLLELVTQVGAVLVLERPEMQGKIAVILQIPSAEVLQWVAPGETVRVEAEVLKLRESFGELRGTISRDGKTVATGQMRFAIADASNLLPADRPPDRSAAPSTFQRSRH